MSGLVRDLANLVHHLTRIFTPGEIYLSHIETHDGFYNPIYMDSVSLTISGMLF